MKNQYTLINSNEEEIRLTNQASSLYGGTRLLDPFIIGSNMKILDAGCGTGVFCQYFAHHNSNFSIIGVDLDEDKIAKNISQNIFSNLNYEMADIYELPFPDNSFDLVHCRFVLMHLNNPRKAISELVRVLKKGGAIILHEGIHDSISITPHKLVTMKLFNLWKKQMESLGQDHSIGLKLYTYLTNAGINNILPEVKVHSAFGNSSLMSIYLKNLLGSLASVNYQDTTITKNEITDIEKELSESIDSYFYLELTVFISGIK